jgi:hypothetical protein
MTRALVVLLLVLAFANASAAQPTLLEVMDRHGVEMPGKSLEAAFDAGMEPTVPVSAGSFATPLAMLAASTGADRIAAAYAFGILAGRSSRMVLPQELAAAGQALLQMVASDDRRTRVAAARVSGRVFAAPFETRVRRPVVPAGMADSLFALLNRTAEIEQLAAMDALGLLRETTAVAALMERYRFYRGDNKRGLAGAAIEALGRIGDASATELIRAVSVDPWAEGKDATALAVAFARERLLKDGSIMVIRAAVDDKSRRAQARGYLDELGTPVP